MIEGGENDKRNKCDEDERYDHLLRPFFFILWPGLKPAGKKRPVIEREIPGIGARRCRKDRKEKPALPVVEGARGEENDSDEEDRTEESLYDRLSVQRIHSETLHPAQLASGQLFYFIRRPVVIPDRLLQIPRRNFCANSPLSILQAGENIPHCGPCPLRRP